MGAVLHPSAGTTPATRKKIQDSKESLKKPAKKIRYCRKYRNEMEEKRLRS